MGATWVGDAVMTIPALRELRRILPRARITLATRAWAQDIFLDADFIDDLLILDVAAGKIFRASLRQSSEMRQERFDLALLFPNAFSSAFITAAARIPFRFGYATDGRSFLLTNSFAVPQWRQTRHQVFYYLHLVNELEKLLAGESVIPQREPRLDLSVSRERQEEGRAFLRERGAQDARPLVALCPGSTNSNAKRWLAANYAALADRLIEEAHADVAIIGSRSEIETANEVAARMRHRPLMLAGETTLAQSIAILSASDLLVSNDTGPAHISGALGRPTIVVFGPTDPIPARPFSTEAEVIAHPPDCAPCHLRECPIDHRCMVAITPDEVYARAIVKLTQSKTFAPALEVSL